MANSSRYQYAREILDLLEYGEQLGKDRPRISEFLKELNIKPEIMWDTVKSTTHLVHIINDPQIAVDAINDLFKLGVTLGYKLAIKRQMEKEFGSLEDSHKE